MREDHWDESAGTMLGTLGIRRSLLGRAGMTISWSFYLSPALAEDSGVSE